MFNYAPQFSKPLKLLAPVVGTQPGFHHDKKDEHEHFDLSCTLQTGNTTERRLFYRMNRTCGTLQRFQCFLKFKCCRCITTVVFTTSTKKGSNGCTSTVFCTVRTVGVRLCTWRNVNGSITEPHLRISMNFSTFKIQALLGRWRCKNSSVLHLWGLDNHLQYLWHIDDLPIKQSLNRHFKDHPWVFPQQGERDQCCRTNVLCVNPGAKVLRGTRRLETVHAHDGRVWKVATCLAVRQLHWPTEFNSPSPGSASRRRTEEHAISSCSGSCRPCAHVGPKKWCQSGPGTGFRWRPRNVRLVDDANALRDVLAHFRLPLRTLLALAERSRPLVLHQLDLVSQMIRLVLVWCIRPLTQAPRSRVALLNVLRER